MCQLSSMTMYDKKSVAFTPSFQNIQQYQSQIGGCCSFVYIIISLLLLFDKIFALWTGSHVYYSMNIIRAYDQVPLDITSANFTLQLRALTSQHSKLAHKHKLSNINQLQLAIPIKFEDLPLYGVQAVYQIYTITYVQQKTVIDIQQYDMVGCEQNSFKICLPSHLNYTVQGNTKFQVKRTSSGQKLRQISLKIKKCNATYDTKCVQNMPYSLMFFLKFYNNLIYPTQSNQHDTIKRQQIFRVIQSQNQLSQKLQITQKVSLKRVTMLTDKSIIPSIFDDPETTEYSNITNWFYDEQLVEQKYLIDQQDITYLSIDIHRSTESQIYYRHYDKIDTMLAAYFGQLSFFALIFFGVYSGYNQWSFKQYQRKCLRISYTQPRLFTYYKVTIIWYVNYFSCGRLFANYCRTQQQLNNILVQKLNYFNHLRIQQQGRLLYSSNQTNNINLSQNRTQNSIKIQNIKQQKPVKISQSGHMQQKLLNQ